MQRIPRRILTEAFKKEAVRLVQTEGLTLAEVGRNVNQLPIFSTCQRAIFSSCLS